MYHQYQQKDEEDDGHGQPSSSLAGPAAGISPPSLNNNNDSPSPMPHSIYSSTTSRHQPTPPPNSTNWPPPSKPVAGEGSSGSDSLSSMTIPNELVAPNDADEQMGSDEFSGDEGMGEAIGTMPKGDGGGRGGEGGGLFGPMQLARAHWIQLHKINMQIPILKRMFLQLIQRHPQLRTLWPFARTFDGSAAQLEHLLNGASFRHFCRAYQSALTMFMDNLDDEPALCRLLQQLGANHFYYDCVESHLRMMRHEFFRSLVDCLAGTSEELDEELADDWKKFWAKLESNLGFGLKVQRHNYLAHCVTPGEMASIREQWYRLVGAEGGVGQLAERIGKKGAEPFMEALAIVGLLGSNRVNLAAMFARASREFLWAMEKAVVLWEPGTGFLRLCAEIDGKCAGANELIRRATAPMVRRAFMEAFGAELTEILAKEPGTSGRIVGEGMDGKGGGTMIHSWTKVNRVAEQAIIADELNGAPE